MSIQKKAAGLFFLIFLFSGVSLFAQSQPETKLSDKELEQFASAYEHVQVINQSSQQKMVSAIENEDMTVEQFNKIQKAVQNKQGAPTASAGEMEKFKTLSQKLGQIQMEAQQKMQKKIAEEGLTLDRYQEIVSMAQTNPELLQKIQEHLGG